MSSPADDKFTPQETARSESVPPSPLPPGEAGRRPGEGAFRCCKCDESTLTPALSQREGENR